MVKQESLIITPDDPKDEVTKIFGSIYVSSYVGAKNFEGDVIFVHHDVQWYTKGLHIPLLSKRPNSDFDRSGAKVNEENLELIHEIMSARFATRRPILIHCKGGVERSPLVVVTWLVNKGFDFDESYRFVKTLRPVVENRKIWLNKNT